MQMHALECAEALPLASPRIAPGIRGDSYQAGQQRHRCDAAADAAMRRSRRHRSSPVWLTPSTQSARLPRSSPTLGRPRSGGTNWTGTTVAVSAATTGGRLIQVSTSWPVTYTAGNAWSGSASKTASHKPETCSTRDVSRAASLVSTAMEGSRPRIWRYWCGFSDATVNVLRTAQIVEPLHNCRLGSVQPRLAVWPELFSLSEGRARRPVPSGRDAGDKPHIECDPRSAGCIGVTSPRRRSRLCGQLSAAGYRTDLGRPRARGSTRGLSSIVCDDRRIPLAI